MRSRTKTIVLGLGILMQLYSAAPLWAEPIWIGNRGVGGETFASISLPPKDRLTLVSFVPLMVESKVLGWIAAYDDRATMRPVDYIELYDNVETLLAIGWVDRFGIERLAVDRAFMDNSHRFEGVFVLVLKGNAV